MVLGGLISGIFGLKAAGTAADAQLEAVDRSIDLQREMFNVGLAEQRRAQDLQRQYMAPQIEAGGNALVEMQRLMGFGTPTSMQGGFDPSTGMWAGAAPFQTSTTPTLAGGNTLARAAAPAPQAAAASGGPASDRLRELGAPPRGTPEFSQWLLSRKARPVGNQGVQHENKAGGVRDHQSGHYFPDKASAVQYREATGGGGSSAPRQPSPPPSRPGSPTPVATPRADLPPQRPAGEQQSNALAGFYGRQAGIYGSDFANTDFGRQQAAIFGEDLTTGGLQGQRTATLGQDFAGNDFRGQLSGIVGDELSGSDLGERRRAILGDNPLAGNDFEAQQDYLYGDEAFRADPGYQFRVEEGNRALNDSLAASGMGLSGAALRASMDYNQGLASQEYNNFYNRQRAGAGDYYNTRTADAERFYNQNVGSFNDFYNRQTNDLQNYLANQRADFGNFYGRQRANYSDDYNRLAAMAGLNQTGSSQLATNAANTANAIASAAGNYGANAGNALVTGGGNAAAYRGQGMSAFGSGLGDTLDLGLGFGTGFLGGSGMSNPFAGLFGGGGGSNPFMRAATGGLEGVY